MTTAYDQLMLDLFTTALEGGIGYWSECSAYHWMIGPPSDDVTRPSVSDFNDFYADIIEYEPDGDGRHRIDRRTMRRGYDLARGDWRDKIRWSSGEPPPWVVHDDTDWDFDAGDADCIVQLGLFGQVVYG